MLLTEQVALPFKAQIIGKVAMANNKILHSKQLLSKLKMIL